MKCVYHECAWLYSSAPYVFHLTKYEHIWGSSWVWHVVYAVNSTYISAMLCSFVLVKVTDVFPSFLLILTHIQPWKIICLFFICFINLFRSGLWFSLDFCAALFQRSYFCLEMLRCFHSIFFSLSLLPMLSVNMASAHIRNNATARRHSLWAGRFDDVIGIYSSIILL